MAASEVLDLVVANGLADGGNAVLMRTDAGWALDRDHPLASIEEANLFSFGDLDHDGPGPSRTCRRRCRRRHGNHHRRRHALHEAALR